jgi:alpha-L-fucosidase
MKTKLWSSVVLLLSLAAAAQPNYQPSAANIANRTDFQDRKFGMFIHWGIYSLLGDGEWVMYNQKIPYNKYKRLANAFYPHSFDAKQWVALAKNVGMKYITITSRHHDGFSMFATKASDYNIVDATPFKRDVLKELADACKAEGLKLNFYYSLLDWGRTDYGFGKPIVNGQPENTNWESYIRFMKAQLTELLTNYGDVVSGIWFDGDWERKEANWHYEELYALIHQLRPDVMIGNNHHTDLKSGEDFQLFEKDLPGGNSHGWNSGGISNAVPLETCETINFSWGFNINDTKFKTSKALIHYLVKAAGHNANFLLNVGPQPDGNIQPEFADTLAIMGDWMKKFGASIYATRGNMIPQQSWGTVTGIGKKLFVHILEMPATDFILVPQLNKKIVNAKSMTTGKAVKWKQVDEGLFLYPDKPSASPIDEIIELEWDAR